MISVAELSRCPPRTQVRVAGRVVSVDAQGAVFADASGVMRAAITGVEINELVAIDATWDGSTLCDATLVERGAPFGSSFAESTRLLSHDRKIAKNLVTRARTFRAVREYFDREGFLEVDTPLAVPSPGLDVHLDAMVVTWKGPERYLITSPEYQMKRLVAGGLSRIYQLCHCFRNDEQGARHEPEFMMVEWYRAWANVDDVMRDTEELVAAVARGIHGRAVVFQGAREIDVTPPWPRITVREAFEWFCGLNVDDVLEDEEMFFRLMVETIEPALDGVGAVFLCEYPSSMASLARKKPGDPKVAERFEAYVAGIELCNGFGELTDPREQRARLERDQNTRVAQGLPVYPIDEKFLCALEEGLPPCGGNALGLDRLVMLVTGAENIEEVLAIPSRLV